MDAQPPFCFAEAFASLVEQAAQEQGVGFVAKRLKKRNCKLCMQGGGGAI